MREGKPKTNPNHLAFPGYSFASDDGAGNCDLISNGSLATPGLFIGGPGLTKREYFASLALQGLLASNHTAEADVVAQAIEYADELIDALNED